MICVSLAEETLDDYLVALEGTGLAEIRLDMTHLTLPEVTRLFSAHSGLIATCRPGPFPDEERKALLLAAIDAGAAYVDIEVDSEKACQREIIARARSRGCKIIVSFHDHEKTPERGVLEATIAECFATGADIAKIACTARSERDNARLLGLLDAKRPVVVVAMGARGRIVRIVAPLLGSPFTFASLRSGRETAGGQIDRESLSKLLEILGKHTAEVSS